MTEENRDILTLDNESYEGAARMKPSTPNAQPATGQPETTQSSDNKEGSKK